MISEDVPCESHKKDQERRGAYKSTDLWFLDLDRRNMLNDIFVGG